MRDIANAQAQQSYQGQETAYRGMPDQTQGVMRELMDTEKIIMSIDLQLQGFSINPLKQNDEGGAVWEQTTKEYINKEIRVKLINLIRSHVNVVTLYSNINIDIIQKICGDLHIAITELLFRNEDKILSRDNTINSDVWTRATLILYMVMDTIWLGLYQAFEHGQRGVIEKIGGFSESRVMPTETKKRKKLLGVI